jgi:hypothetical protein
MIVPFTIDPDVFSTTPNSRENLAKHKQLIELWRDFGVLVIPGTGKNNSRICTALNNSDPKILTLWRNCFKQCTHILENESVDEALKKSDFEKVSSQKIKLWSIEESKEPSLGLEEASHSKIIKNSEFCMFGYEQHSNLFIEAKELSKSPISASDDPEKTWKERFLPLCKYASNIIVCDPHLIQNFWSSKGKKFSGIERLIKNVAEINSDKPKILHIYSSNRIGAQTADFYEIYEKLTNYCSPFKNKSIREIRLHLTTLSEYRPQHYRMFKFDDHHLVTSDSGIELLGEEGRNRTHDFNLKHLYDESSKPYRDDLKRLELSMSFNKVIELNSHSFN